jgi:putative membrane protein
MMAASARSPARSELDVEERKTVMLALFAQSESGLQAWEKLGTGALSAIVFGLIGIVLLLLGYWLFDRITPRIDVEKELNEKNVAVAIVVASLLLGIAYIVAHVVQ